MATDPTTTTDPTTAPPTGSVSSIGTTDGGTMTGTTLTSGDPTTTTAGTTAGGTTMGIESTTTDGTTTSDGTTGGSSTTGVPVDCQPGDTMGGGDVEKSFLWVANSDEGSVSKIDTQTMIELARYRTGPLGGGYAENPSRTAVSFDGKYMIVNGRSSGRSTVIAANLGDCVDKNGNGKIDTSQNKSDLLACGSAIPQTSKPPTWPASTVSPARSRRPS